MGFLDILLALILGYGCIRGIWNGFFVELASLLSLLVGIWAAIKFSHLTKIILESHVSWNPKTIQIVAFAVTFIIVVVGIAILAKMLTAVSAFAGLGLFNKLLGGIAGVLKMILIISVSLNLFAKLNSGNHFVEKETIDKSILYNPILNLSQTIYPTLQTWFSELKIPAE